MILKQISIFIENKKGHLAAVTNELTKHGIDIRAISVFDTTEFGILRMIVDKPDVAINILNENGYTAKASEVLAVEPEDKPGSLNEIFNIFDINDINVEYIYSFVLRKRSEMPLIIFKVNDRPKAIQVLEDAGIKVVEKKEIQD